MVSVNHRGMQLDDRRLESLLTLRKALKAGGLIEPQRDPNKADQRMKVKGLREYIVANFVITPGQTWGQIEADHKEPHELVTM